MPDQPQPRRWLQLHLSTCIVLMFVVGGLLFTNLRPARVIPGSLRFDKEPINKEPLIFRAEVLYYGRGWPFAQRNFLSVGIYGETKPSYDEMQARLSTSDYEHTNIAPVFGFWEWKYLIADLAVALAILALTGILCEYVLRRRERAKQP